MSQYLTSAALISLLTLTLMEIVLGVDNVIFISIIAGRLPLARQGAARQIGLLIALFVRIGLLFSITWIVGLKDELLHIAGRGFSGRDLILLGGGLFLIGKTVSELHEKLEGDIDEPGTSARTAGFAGTIVQIVLIDIVFSFDSIPTAVGLSRDLPIMIGAVVISLGVMMAFSGAVSRFIDAHPTIKVLALAFLIMIGLLLVVEAFGVEVNKGYVYFAMAFALGIEFINMAIRKKGRKVQLHDEKQTG